jgi:hypothetical protein
MRIAGILPAKLLAPLCLAALSSCAAGLAIQANGKPDAAGALARPAGVDKWITVGTTMRMKGDDPAIPDQFRHIQLEPGAYKALLDGGAYPDGAVLAATFYSARHDEDASNLYTQDKQVFFGLEVIDKSHPDGRRFYSFTEGAATAPPLPAGNACAVCHNAKGGLQGTFTQHYPVIARFAKGPPAAASRPAGS